MSDFIIQVIFCFCSADSDFWTHVGCALHQLDANVQLQQLVQKELKILLQNLAR